MMTFMLSSCVRGYHVYRDIWNPSVGETVNCEREGRNPEDSYTVALQKDDIIVGHYFMCVHIIFKAWWCNSLHSNWPKKVFRSFAAGRAGVTLYVLIYWTRQCNKEGTSIAIR